jgi:hypothetical protein
VIFNSRDYPDIKVLDALIASCSIPFIFPPRKINDLWYVDGATKGFYNYMNSIIDDKMYVLKLNECQYCEDSMTTLFGYIKEITTTMIRDESLIPKKRTLIINLSDKYKNKVNFSDIKMSDKTELFITGLKQCELLFK